MLAGAEAFDRLRALLLRAIGVQRRGANVLGLQLTRDPIGADLRAHEHQHGAGRVAPHEVREPVHLVAARGSCSIECLIVRAAPRLAPTCR